MRIVEKSSAKKKLCGWKKKEFQSEGKNILCMLPIFPETTTLVFKSNPRNPDANLNDMIFVKDKPKIKHHNPKTNKRGYSGVIYSNWVEILR